MKQIIPRLLADDSINQIFGTVNKPPGPDVSSNPAQAVADVIGFMISLVFLVGGLATLLYLLLGAFDWITSEGQKEKLEKAQRKIMNAVVGLLLIVIAFVGFNFFMCTVLNGKLGIGCGLKITLPKLGN